MQRIDEKNGEPEVTVYIFIIELNYNQICL